MTKDDLQKFCADDDDIRYYLRQPWSAGEFSYATNGHILVHVPRLAYVPYNDKAPDAQALIDKTAPSKEWLPVPGVEMPPDVACTWCDGTGKDPNDRRCKCEECLGAKTMPDRSGIELAGTAFAKRYLAMIQGWEIAPNGQKAAWIRHGDTLGLLMPMRM